jgi:hypothetical protein
VGDGKHKPSPRAQDAPGCLKSRFQIWNIHQRPELSRPWVKRRS